MKEYRASEIKNVAIIGHSGEGKTTLTEAMLYNANAVERQVKVPDGNTVSDFDPEEIARKISIGMSVCFAEYGGCKFNFIDVPGFFDFEGELTGALTAADSAVVVVGANGTVSVGTEKALAACARADIPVTVFINGMDKENADYFAAVEALRGLYPTKIAPLQIPIMRAGKMQGYVSVLSGNAYEFSAEGRKKIGIPGDLASALEEIVAALAEVAAEGDDELMEKFFEDGTLSREDIIRGVRLGIEKNSAIPVIAGSALANRGVFNLMDNLVRLAPSPKCSEDAPFSAQVFKTVADPFVGRLSIFKVRSGVLRSGMTVRNAARDSSEKIGGLYLLRGKKQFPVNALYAGDIGAAAKFTGTFTGDTLCAEGAEILYEPPAYPAPVLSMAVFAAKQGEEDKVFQGLARLREEDCTFTVERDPETGETILKGMGETQLEILLKKLRNKYGADAVLRDPQIPYRETIRGTAEARGKHKKQSGGHGQYGDVAIRFSPCPEERFVFEDAIVGGVVPKAYIPAVEKGLRECIAKGVLAGYPVTGLRCTLFDGSYHEVDSSEMAFMIAASLAYKEGMTRADPVLLEPVWLYRIRIPSSCLGDVLGDLNKRRGRILGMEPGEEDTQTVSAEVPLAEMLKYATDLRSMTQGRGSFSSEFVRYEEVPSNLAQKIIERRKNA